MNVYHSLTGVGNVNELSGEYVVLHPLPDSRSHPFRLYVIVFALVKYPGLLVPSSILAYSLFV
jgi:hypothetical protein